MYWIMFFVSRRKGITSLILAIVITLYSLSIVLLAMSVWSRLVQTTGVPMMKITKPVRLFTHGDGS
jgi:hypothetical protein